MVERTSKAPPNPSGLCLCGCGEKTPLATNNGGANRKGHPVRYLRGHNGKRGADHPQWKGGRYLRGGYWVVQRPGHRFADAKGWVLEHRLIWEEANGRELRAGECVHHVNGDSQDNRPENLVAIVKADHSRIHAHRRWHGQDTPIV